MESRELKKKGSLAVYRPKSRVKSLILAGGGYWGTPRLLESGEEEEV